MKNIGIITFHDTTNYGATLQAYALQSAIEKLGFSCTIVDYRIPKHIKQYGKLELSDQKSWKELLRYILINRSNNKKIEQFSMFRKNFYKLSNAVYFDSTIVQSNTFFDVFIVGSDQVWNNDITHNDTTYLLDFVEEGKTIASYAASFGKEKIPGELQEIYKKLLVRFTKISVREQQGMQLVKSLVNKPIEVVLDPVFLLSKEDWEKIAIPVKHISRKYILLYVFGRPSRLFKLARAIAKETGYKIVIIGTDYRRQFGFYYTGSIGPEQFIGYLLNASYVLTNSFHGTAFSINFNKQFFLEMLPNGSKVNSRLANIMNLLDLCDRQLTDGAIPDFRKLIDYDRVNKKLNSEKQKSYKFLEEAINFQKEKPLGTN